MLTITFLNFYVPSGQRRPNPGLNGCWFSRRPVSSAVDYLAQVCLKPVCGRCNKRQVGKHAGRWPSRPGTGHPLVSLFLVGTSVGKKGTPPMRHYQIPVSHGSKFNWFNSQSAFNGCMFCARSLKMGLKTCVVTFQRESFENAHERLRSMGSGSFDVRFQGRRERSAM